MENNSITEKISLPVMLRAAPAGYCHISETWKILMKKVKIRTEDTGEFFTFQQHMISPLTLFQYVTHSVCHKSHVNYRISKSGSFFPFETII